MSAETMAPAQDAQTVGEPAAAAEGASVEPIVLLLRRDAPYWAPEVKASRLAPYLDHFGKPLYDALRALPEEEQKVVGVDRFVEVAR